jgi:hypothetical protein
MVIEHHFKFDLANSSDTELFRDACIDIYNKSTQLGGECTAIGSTFTAVEKTWKKFINPIKETKSSLANASAWKLLKRCGADNATDLLGSCEGDLGYLKTFHAEMCGDTRTDLKNRKLTAAACEIVIKDVVNVFGPKPDGL